MFDEIAFNEIAPANYNLYPINNQQYQSYSDKTLLKFDEYLEKIRPELTRLMINCKVNLNVNFVFKSIRNFNDKRTLCIKAKNPTDIDDVTNELIKKHEELTKLSADINLISEGIKSITYNY